ncbi:dihydrofolate reductase family protein [Streptomyces fagopyri]|uniref:dihydrofolate reductase family protein n=1 Tax=Streptomyces fagopyri TaxID=2662397 RepID=UPI001D1706E5|nr:dihydrofolate reductase family protein [Streptomyces fagopyri]
MTKWSELQAWLFPQRWFRENLKLGEGGEAAGDRDVRIAGGAETIQEYLDGGLIDEFSITLAPVLFGTGIRLFDRVDPTRLVLDQTRTDASSRVTHLTYTVGKR